MMGKRRRNKKRSGKAAAKVLSVVLALVLLLSSSGVMTLAEESGRTAGELLTKAAGADESTQSETETEEPEVPETEEETPEAEETPEEEEQTDKTGETPAEAEKTESEAQTEAPAEQPEGAPEENGTESEPESETEAAIRPLDTSDPSGGEHDLERDAFSITITVTDSSGAPYDPEKVYGREERFTFRLDYETLEYLIEAGERFHLPDGLALYEDQGSIYDSQNRYCGMYYIRKEGGSWYVFFEYDTEWEAAHRGDDGGLTETVHGYFTFSASLNAEATDHQNETTIIFPGTGDAFTFLLEDGTVTAKKEGVLSSDGTADFTVTFTVSGENATVSVTDTLGENLSFVENSFFLDGADVSGSVSINGGTATATFNNLSIGTHTLTYRVMPGENFTGDSMGNTVNYEWVTENGTEPHEGSTEGSVWIQKSWMNKSGSAVKDEDGGLLITWDITVYPGALGSVLGTSLTDTLGEHQAYVEGSLSVLRNYSENVGDAGVTVMENGGTLTFTFPESFSHNGNTYSKETEAGVTYQLTYQTKVAAEFLPEEGERADFTNHVTDEFGDEAEGSVSYTEEGKQYDLVSKSGTLEKQEEETVRVLWSITVDPTVLDEDEILSGLILTDYLQMGNETNPSANAHYTGTITVTGQSGRTYTEGEDYTVIWRSGWNQDQYEAVEDPTQANEFELTFLTAPSEIVTVSYEAEYTLGEYDSVVKNEVKSDYEINGIPKSEDDSAQITVDTPTVSKNGMTKEGVLNGTTAAWTLLINYDESNQYNGHTAGSLGNGVYTVTDHLPDGMVYAEGTAAYELVGQVNSSKEVDPSLKEYIRADYDKENNTLTFIVDFSEETAGTFYYSNFYIVITYSTEITDLDDKGEGSISYTNDASYGKDGETLGSDSATVTIDKILLDKQAALAAGAINQIQYTVAVNYQGADLDPESDVLILTDTLDPNVTLLLDSVRAAKMFPDGEPVDFTAGYALTADGRGQLTVTVPDGVALLITYCVNVTGETGSILTVDNHVSLAAQVGTEDENEFEIEIQDASAGVRVDDGTLTIYKIDAEAITVSLSGAVFELYLVGSAHGDLDFEGTYLNSVTTDEGGTASFTGLGEDALYYYVETKAPEGYIRPDPAERVYFILSDDRNSEEYQDLVKAAEEAGITVASWPFEGGYTLNVPNDAEKEISVSLIGEKQITGITETEEVFTFELYETDGSYEIPEGAEPSDTVTVNGAGGFFFTLTYGEEDAGETFYYVIREKTGKAAGWAYDETEVKVSVTVTYDASGELTVSVSGLTAEEDGVYTGADFTNVYEAEGALALTGKKTFTGGTLLDGMFTFNVTEGETVVSTGFVDREGNIVFTEITYQETDLGDHVYTVTEVDDGKEGVTYSKESYTVEVTVSDNGDGTLTAEVTSGNQNSLDFTNSYEAAGSLTLTGQKFFEGGELAEGLFTFTVTEDGKTVSIGSADETGAIIFAPIVYEDVNSVGEHIYLVTEDEGDLPGVTYSKESYTVIVTVSDAGDGTLTAEVTSGNQDSLDFTNSYEAAGSLTLTGQKTFTGGTLTEGLFTFTVTEGETVVSTGFADENGAITFTPIVYEDVNSVGEHVYLVSEDEGDLPGVTYSKESYTVIVTVSDAGDGTLTAEVTSGNQDSLDFTNSYEAAGSLTFTGQKTFTGGTLTEGLFTFTVEEDGRAVSAGTVAEDGTIVFTEITYTLSDVGDHEYVVTEDTDALPGVIYDETEYHMTVSVSDEGTGELKVEVTSKDGDSLTFTNEIERVDLSGKKTWNDHGDAEGKRPTEITIRLYADTVEIDSQIVTEKEDWAWSFTGLPKYENGNEITYTITEDTVEDYETTVTGFDVINDYTKDFTSLNVVKLWEDDYDRDGKRPEEITVELLADREPALNEEGDEITAVLSEETGWSYTFSDLNKYDENDKEIVYTVAELTAEGLKDYESSILPVEGTATIFLENRYTPETVEIEGEKIWEDDNDRDGRRPSSVTIRLLADGEPAAGIDGNFVEPAAVTEKDNWHYRFTDLPKYRDGGTEISYTVTEDPVEGYETSLDGFTVTNAYLPEKTDIRGEKTWADADNQDGIRPVSVTVHLFADEELIDSVTVSAGSGGWEYSFTGLPKYRDGGIEIKYTVTEEAVDGYESSVEGFDIENRHVPETVSIEGTKTWEDSNDQDGVRPSEVVIRLYADGEPALYDNGNEVEAAVITEAEGWRYCFLNLPKYRDGTEIIYSILEDEILDYTAEINGYDVTNRHTPEETGLTVQKIWNDERNQDGIRPDEITVHLLGDGEPVLNDTGEEVTAVLSKENGFSWNFEKLPKYENGKEIIYTIREDPVEGYTAQILPAEGTTGIFIENGHTPETVDLTGEKIWVDADNQDGLRPDEITLRLLADGEEVYHFSVTEKEDWKWALLDLPKYRDGEEILYAVTEDAVDGYESSVEGYDVTNTLRTEKESESETETESESVNPGPGTKNGGGKETGYGSSSVKTGDETPVGLLIALLILAAAVLAVLAAVRCRRRKEES